MVKAVKNIFKKRITKKQEEKGNFHFRLKDCVVHLFLLETRPCYDTSWLVCIKSPIGADIIEKIVRFDNETASGLMKDIISLPCITSENLRSLDKRDMIFYD